MLLPQTLDLSKQSFVLCRLYNDYDMFLLLSTACSRTSQLGPVLKFCWACYHEALNVFTLDEAKTMNHETLMVLKSSFVNSSSYIHCTVVQHDCSLYSAEYSSKGDMSMWQMCKHCRYSMYMHLYHKSICSRHQFLWNLWPASTSHHITHSLHEFNKVYSIFSAAIWQQSGLHRKFSQHLII